MAFLCPSRLGRKQKKDHQSLLNKISETSNIDSITIKDLVKLSLTTPEARRIVLQSFTACAVHELTVKQGQKVRYIYREGDWAYIVTNDKKEGFVPYTVLAKLGVPTKTNGTAIDTGTYTKNTIDIRKISVESEDANLSVSDNADDSLVSSEWSNDSFPETGSIITSPLQCSPLLEADKMKAPDDHHNSIDDIDPPSPFARYRVINDYKGQDSIEVSVRADDVVHLLNTSDPNWSWVRTPDGAEGYMPSYYITEISNDDVFLKGKPNANTDIDDSSYKNNHTGKSSNIDIEYEYDLNTTHRDDQSSVASDELSLSDRATASDLQPLQKKERPQKPPRKNKPRCRSTSQNLNDSVDSLDSMLTDSTMGGVNDSVFDYSFSAESFIQEDTDQGVDDSDSVLESPREKRLASGLSYRELIGLHLKPNNTKHRHSSRHDDLLRIKSSRRSQRAHSEHANASHNVRDTNNSTTTLQKRQSSKYSVYSENIESDYSFRSRSSERQKSRPVSVPAFKSFQESGSGYYDEYFYEDSDTKFTSTDDHDVINVSEILKMRMVKERGKRDRADGNMKHDTQMETTNHYHRENPRIKPFLFNLPSTNIDSHTSKCNTGNKCTTENEASRVGEQTVKNRRHRSSRRDNEESVSLNNHRQTNGTTSAYKVGKNCEPLSMNRKHHSSTDLRSSGKSNEANNVTKKATVNVQGSTVAGKTSSKKHPVIKQYNSTTDLRTNGDYIEDNSKARTKLAEHKNNVNVQGTYTNSRDEPGHTHKRKRQYNSSSDLRSTDDSGKTAMQHHHHKLSGAKEGMQSDHSVDIGRTSTRRYNSSTDLRHINGPPDWSFGYPRKNRHASGSNCPDARNQNSEKANKQGTISSKDVIIKCYNNGDSSDDNLSVKTNRQKEHGNDEKNMMMLLSQTEDLLHVSEDLLDSDSDSDSMYESVQKSNAKVNKEANEKCSQFLTNSTIGINGMLNGPRVSETTSVHNESKNKTKVKLKSIEVQTDMNEDICSTCSVCSSGKRSGQNSNHFSNDVRGITEFVSQCDYEPENDNMLPMKLGEVVHVGLDGQHNDQWYWAFSPRLRQYGFIPKQHVKIPMVTII